MSRTITLAQFGVLSVNANLPIPVVETPKALPKRSPIKFGNIVYRVAQGGGIGVVTSVTRYKGGFRYSVVTPAGEIYDARVSGRIDPRNGIPEVQEIEVLWAGNAFRPKRTA